MLSIATMLYDSFQDHITATAATTPTHHHQQSHTSPTPPIFTMPTVATVPDPDSLTLTLHILNRCCSTRFVRRYCWLPGQANYRRSGQASESHTVVEVDRNRRLPTQRLGKSRVCRAMPLYPSMSSLTHWRERPSMHSSARRSLCTFCGTSHDCQFSICPSNSHARSLRLPSIAIFHSSAPPVPHSLRMHSARACTLCSFA